jgi:hypothetical protein
VVASSKDSAKHRRHDPRQLANTAVRQPASVSRYRTPATTLSAKHWSIGNLVRVFPLVWGARDPTHRKTACDELAPGARVVELARAAHFPDLEDVPGFVAVVTSFVA